MKKKLISCVYIRRVCIISAWLMLWAPLYSTAGEPETRMLTDMAGRRVVLKIPVQTMVTTFKPATLCAFSLGLADRLAGVDTSSRMDRLQKSVYPKIADVATVGRKSTGISFETIAGIKPDLVILYSQKDGLALADRLEKINIPAIIIIPENFETIKAAMRLIAVSCGVSNRMAGIESRMDAMLQMLDQRLARISETDKKRAYFASSQGLFSTTTGSMLQHEIFTRAGLINVSAGLSGYFQNISPEQLIKWNPDVIVISQHARKSQAQKLSQKVLSPITAVAQKNVYRCPSSLAPWDFPSPLSVLGSLWLAKKVYPKDFSDIELQEQADAFHYMLFGKTMSEMNGKINDFVAW